MFIFQQPLAQRDFAQRGLYYMPVEINIGVYNCRMLNYSSRRG